VIIKHSQFFLLNVQEFQMFLWRKSPDTCEVEKFTFIFISDAVVELASLLVVAWPLLRQPITACSNIWVHWAHNEASSIDVSLNLGWVTAANRNYLYLKRRLHRFSMPHISAFCRGLVCFMSTCELHENKQDAFHVMAFKWFCVRKWGNESLWHWRTRFSTLTYDTKNKLRYLKNIIT